jgi:hypothetical protein
MRRAQLFIALCAVCVLAASGYALFAANRRGQQQQQIQTQVASDAPAPPDVLASVMAQPHVVYLYSPTGDQYRRVAIAPLDAPDKQYLTPLQCQRVYAVADEGLCLGNNYVSGITSSYNAYTFDSTFQPGFTFQQAGTPSRVRLAPTGAFGSMTLFVAGHSYADGAFSTATTLVDMKSGETVANLEQFTVYRDGAVIQAPDYNFWGVTFARDGNRFYATLGSAGTTYLVEGDLAARQMRVLREGVECPSLSPDGTRLAYKQLVSSTNTRTWRLAVMDLATLEDRPIASETRNVDDQVEWYDDDHLLYALPDEGPPATLATHIWLAPVDGAEAPRILLRFASSPAVVR